MMRGRVVLVTGSTSGIGKAAALALARQGATVLVVGRDRERGEAAVAELRSGAGGERVELFVADLGSQASVRGLARAVSARHPVLHALVNNAGAIFMTRRVTVDGIESTLAVNHLAPFLLTLLLLDRLEAAGDARVVNVSSEAHRAAGLDLDDLQSARRYSGLRAYCRSKLANILFTYELARRLAGTGVTANCVHPGGVNTNIWRESTGFVGALVAVARPLMRTAESGADPVVRLVTSRDLDGVSGKYFVRGTARRSSRASYDLSAADRLWEASLALAPAHREPG